MAGGKETPRQKMIGMMYLVLTALLALNISNEVLDGFVKVEKGLTNTTKNLEEQAGSTYDVISQKLNGNEVAVGPFSDKAIEVVELSDFMEDYVHRMKAYSLAASQGELDEISKYLVEDSLTGKQVCVFLGAKNADDEPVVGKKDENQEITTFLGLAEPTSPLSENPFHTDSWGQYHYTAVELRGYLEAYRDTLVNMSFVDHKGIDRSLTPEQKKSISDRFNFDEGPYTIDEGKIETGWEAATFWHVPVAAVQPLLTKIIIDIKAAEAEVLASLLSGIDAKSYKFTDLLPLVVPSSSIVMKGDTLRADILLAAFDPTKKAEIYVEDANWTGTTEEYLMDSTQVLDIGGISSLELDSLGRGKLAMSTKNMPYGDYVFRGVLNHNKPDGSPESIKFVTPPITVSEPALVVSPTQMNVFYRGLDNPVEISVPGVPLEDLRVTIDKGHSIKRDGRAWVVTPNLSESIREANISVIAKMPDGSEQRLPTKNFRVKRIPTPEPMVGKIGASSPIITKAKLASPPPVLAELGEDFVFKVTARVASFTLTYWKNGTPLSLKSKDPFFTSEMKDAVRRFKSGDEFYIEDILATMPTGKKRPLAPLKLTVQ